MFVTACEVDGFDVLLLVGAGLWLALLVEAGLWLALLVEAGLWLALLVGAGLPALTWQASSATGSSARSRIGAAANEA